MTVLASLPCRALLGHAQCLSRTARSTCLSVQLRPWPTPLPARTCCRSRLIGRARQPKDDRPSTSYDDEEGVFNLFDWPAYSKGWEVPWSGGETALTMVVWAASFLAVGLVLLPGTVILTGRPFSSLSPMDKTLLALLNQAVTTAVGLAVVRWPAKKYSPLPDDLFRYDLNGPIAKPNGWLVWGSLGVMLSPLVVYLASAGAESVGYDGVSGSGTVDAVSQLLTVDTPTFLALFATAAILAPLLEETVFRGFLLTSLTKFMPTPAAVAASSLAFGLIHFAPRDFPQLTALGVLLGFSYVRSRNLLTPIMIHGAWNGTVLVVLYILTLSGVDIDKLVHSGL